MNHKDKTQTRDGHMEVYRLCIQGVPLTAASFKEKFVSKVTSLSLLVHLFTHVCDCIADRSTRLRLPCCE